jgi:hypothetical protein
MMRLLVLLTVLMWMSCGYFNYGYTLGHMTHRFPCNVHVIFALIVAAMGPFGTFAVLLFCQPLHWRTKPLTVEERWKAFHEEYHNLSRDYFERNCN